MAIDLKAQLDRDWLYLAKLPGYELVTLEQADLGGDPAGSITSVPAVKKATSGGPAGMGEGGQAVPRTARFHLRASALSGYAPRRGDRIASATSGTWEVMSVAIQSAATRFVCECVRPLP